MGLINAQPRKMAHGPDTKKFDLLSFALIIHDNFFSDLKYKFLSQGGLGDGGIFIAQEQRAQEDLLHRSEKKKIHE